MELKFKIQQYQTNAVDNTIEVFNGQPNLNSLEYKIDKGNKYTEVNGKRIEQKDIYDDMGYRNEDIVLSQEELLKNINKIQTANNIHLSKELVNNLGACQLDIEMETGTGKTYVYIKTMFELNKRYGWTKFIVVVPSIAIREGVKKSFDITQSHFMEIYGKRVRYFIYNSNNLNQIDAYSQSADINVMIINTQAFNTLKEGSKNKVARIIYDKRDEFGSRRPIDVIATNRPIIILDEPQKMSGRETQNALTKFKPLFTLNYSATHKETHNLIYVLDALDAYNQKLVKKIEVVGFELKNLKGTDSYLYLDNIILSKNNPPQARLEIEIQDRNGNIKRTYKNITEGDDLYFLSGKMQQYKGYTVTEICIDPMNSFIVFGNGIKLYVKEIQGNITADHKVRIQIRETIKAHFRKEAELYKRGIKCLSLFFIDKVENYRWYDDHGNQKLGRYGKIFEQEYMAVFNENRNLFDPNYISYLLNISANDTHTGYFSIDKNTGHAIDSVVKRGSDQSDDISAYDLILKNKERLLSFAEPVRFIFSHSALKEGWDNPNVFQICSFRQSNSGIQKRQEVGRGLRLCVDQNGIRQDNDTIPNEVHKINKLTVIASEGYASFVADLQKDIKQDLYDRPTKADTDFFVGKIFILEDSSRHTVSKEEAQDIYFQLRTNGYITKDATVTEAFRNDLAKESLKPLTDELNPYTNQIYKLLQGIFDPNILDDMIENGSKINAPENKLNDNFSKKEFQELWKRINHKYAYTVEFDSNELIDKAIYAINKELTVTQLSYIVTRGEQKDNATLDDMKTGSIMNQQESATDKLKTAIVSNIKYDLLGKISSTTKLTRKTIATILSKIRPQKFNLYKANPEEFIRNVSHLILEQKATIIVEHITYNQVEGSFDSNIFTQEKHTTIDKAFEGKKSIVDYVFTDSKNEMEFVKDIDTAKEVVVYAKLPKGFHIPTPIGNYSPDWAIVFQEGEVKHLYFVAETKGSMSSMDLRKIEENKIACAEKLFEKLSADNIKYGKIDSFATLMDIVK